MKIRKIISLILTLLIFAAGMVAMRFTYNFKYLDSTYRWKAFYALPENSVDVLGLGTSHCYEAINTARLWRKYGVTAFDLCGALQPMTNTYYFFKEALKTQKPRVVLLDLYSMCINDEYTGNANGVKNTYGMRLSRDKLDAIDATFESPRQYYYSILQYHSRYGDLKPEDFFPYLGNEWMYKDYKGFYCHFEIEDLFNYGDLSGVTGYKPLLDKNRQALLDIIALAKREEINLVLLGLPFGATAYNEQIYRTCGLIARANGVPFYDFLSEYREALGLDYKNDFADRQHVNHSGSIKVTDWICENVLTQFEMSYDGDEVDYSTWSRDADVFERQYGNYILANSRDIREYSAVLASDIGYTVLVTSTGIAETDVAAAVDNGLFDCLDNLGIGDGSKIYGDGGWMLNGGEIRYYDKMTDVGMAETVSLSRFHDAALVRVPDENAAAGFRNSILVDGSNITDGRHSALYIAVYDDYTDELVDCAYFDYEKLTFGHLDINKE